MDECTDRSTHVARILFKEFSDGDRRKIIAQSNDSATGGGARDLRFGSFDSVFPVVEKMFPTQTRQSRKRNGIVQEISLFKGVFYWRGTTGATESKDVFFEPPTDARATEGRITRVHEYGCFDLDRLPSTNASSRLLVMLIQLMDGTVWPYYVDEASIRTPGLWNPIVAAKVIACLDARRPEGVAAIGSYDFTNGATYCNGK